VLSGIPDVECAGFRYNQTRNCFLGWNVVAGDFSYASLDDWMPTLQPNSGSGLWMAPVREFAATSLRGQLDLVYLDKNSKVVDVVECAPTNGVSPSSPPASSVLALPTRSIYASQTQPGDQLMLCAAAEILWRLNRLSSASTVTGAVQDSVPGLAHFTQESPGNRSSEILPKGGSDLPQPEESFSGKIPKSLQIHEVGLNERETKDKRRPRNWLQRWWSPDPPDPRKAPREPAPGLSAHYWTRGPPKAHTIRDISATGLYIVNQERWSPGTLIRMTLTMANSLEPPNVSSITIQTRAVRWGNDGVGLEFVLQEARKMGRGQLSPLGGADCNQLDQFLKRARAANR
jgi:hypothetical protein